MSVLPVESPGPAGSDWGERSGIVAFRPPMSDTWQTAQIPQEHDPGSTEVGVPDVPGAVARSAEPRNAVTVA